MALDSSRKGEKLTMNGIFLKAAANASFAG